MHSPTLHPLRLRLGCLGGGSPLMARRPMDPLRLRSGLPGAIPSDAGIRGPLHPLRLRCPPSPYRSGYASVGRLAGSGSSTLSVLGLFGNGPAEAGSLRPLLRPLRRPFPLAPQAAARNPPPRPLHG